MVGKSIEEQLRAHPESLSEPKGPTSQLPPTPRMAAHSIDYSSPLEAARLERQRIDTGLVDNSRSAPPPPRHEHRAADPEWAPRVKHRQFVKSRGLPYSGSTRNGEPARRVNHCYYCKSTVDSQLHALCHLCSMLNIICPKCGACGCGWASAAQMIAGDIEFGDDAESWIVSDKGVIVFPDAVAGLSESGAAAECRAAYAAYLRSPTWRAKREGALKNSWFRCEECGSQGSDLHVHHVTYDRVGGDERPEDLQVLCSDCHYYHHAFAKAYVAHVRSDPA